MRGVAGTTGDGGTAVHWKRLGIVPGAPECVIKAAHLALIEVHHPDRGGDANIAKEINAAYDELRGRGSQPNEYVAANYNGEPWAVLGVSSAADAKLVTRAGRQLAAELQTHRRLAERVEWAIQHFASALAAPRRERIAPMTAPPPPRPRTPKRAPRPAAPASPGPPDGLPATVDFGKVPWGHNATKTVQLTWKHAAPYGLTVECDGPVRAEVTVSKVLPGRFSVTFTIDWDSPEFSRDPATRGYTLDAEIMVRWTSKDTATIRARGLVLYPALVSASPPSLDLGSVRLSRPVRASLVLVSTAGTDVTIDPPAWLQRVDGSGRVLDVPLKLATNTAVRVEFRVDWAPIAERGRASFDAGRPVHATGRIVVRWNDRELEIPAEITSAK
jgi:hypothetical protein